MSYYEDDEEYYGLAPMQLSTPPLKDLTESEEEIAEQVFDAIEKAEALRLLLGESVDESTEEEELPLPVGERRILKARRRKKQQPERRILKARRGLKTKSWKCDCPTLNPWSKDICESCYSKRPRRKIARD